MGPLTSVKAVLIKKYATFSGRASRSEFWWFTFFYYLFLIFAIVLCSVILRVLDKTGLVDEPSSPLPVVMMVVAVLGWLALLMPGFAVTVRRLHDRGWSGWWVLAYYVGTSIIAIIPVFGAIFAFAVWVGAVVLLSCPGDAGTNRFGDNPLIMDAARDVFA